MSSPEKSSFAERQLKPAAITFAAVIAVLAFAFALSRILLAVPELASVGIAVGVAAVIMGAAFVIERYRQINPTMIGAILVVSALLLGIGGALGEQAGIRPLEHAAGDGHGEHDGHDSHDDEHDGHDSHDDEHDGVSDTDHGERDEADDAGHTEDE